MLKNDSYFFFFFKRNIIDRNANISRIEGAFLFPRKNSLYYPVSRTNWRGDIYIYIYTQYDITGIINVFRVKINVRFSRIKKIERREREREKEGEREREKGLRDIAFTILLIVKTNSLELWRRKCSRQPLHGHVTIFARCNRQLALFSVPYLLISGDETIAMTKL